MAYIPYYTANFTNEQSQEVLVTIYKKDGDPDTVVANYEVTKLDIEDKSEGQTKYDSTIITRELVLGIWSTQFDEITWETFITAEHDEWQIIVLIDDMKYFEGWLTPDEGNALFQDKPYEITIRATNGLSLLKEIPLVNVSGAKFSSNHKLIDYIAGALKQTGLNLPIRCKCQYFNSAMADKADGINFDMFSQTDLNYRSFQQDAITFISCYDALKLIFDKFCRLEYWNGRWLIKSIAELQYIPGDIDYYVEYDSNGANPLGAIDPENYAQIGKSVDLYPINEDQQIYSRFATKSAKTIYNYTVWPELPKNNKFERGTALVSSSGNVFETDANGDNTSTLIGTFQDYTIEDWAFGSFDSTISQISNLPTLSPGVDIAYRRSSSNFFGIEFNREIVIEKSTGSTQVVQSEGIPVYTGDKLRLTFDFKLSFNYGDQLNIAAALVYIAPTGGGTKIWWRDGAGFSNVWREGGAAAQSIFLNYQDANDRTKVYKSFTLESPPVPVDGMAYLQLLNVMDDSLPNMAFFKNVSIEYLPYITGGYIQVKGDYWLRSQNKVFPDVAVEEVLISDSPKKAFKGSLLTSAGELTTPTWYRYGLSESRHFKELLNIARFNHSYRRMYAVEGSFNGLNYSPENDPLNKKPIGFHKRYRMTDMIEPRDFVLVPPLKMDIVKGWITANMVEVRKDADGDSDGTQVGDSDEFKYIF